MNRCNYRRGGARNVDVTSKRHLRSHLTLPVLTFVLLLALVTMLAACSQVDPKTLIETASVNPTLVTDDPAIAEALDTAGVEATYVETEDLTEAFLEAGAALSFSVIPENFKLPLHELEIDPDLWCDPKFCDPAGATVAFSYNALYLPIEHAERLAEETGAALSEVATFSGEVLEELGSVELHPDCKLLQFRHHPHCLKLTPRWNHKVTVSGWVCIPGHGCDKYEEDVYLGSKHGFRRLLFLESFLRGVTAVRWEALMLTGEGVGPSLFRAELSVRQNIDLGVAAELMERLTQPDVQQALAEHGDALPRSREAFTELNSDVQEGALSAFAEGVGSFSH